MKIAVYCGTCAGTDPAYTQQAEALGVWMAKNGHTLVFGGGNIGLMGVIAKAVSENGGKVIGVLPGDIGFITSRPQPYCTEIITEADMTARKRKMMEIADVYIAFPGGLGTLDEITEVMCLVKIDYLQKPAIVFNIKGFYDPYIAMLRKMTDCGFMTEDDLSRFFFPTDVEEIKTFISSNEKK